MELYTVIAVNQTGSPIELDDLGQTVPASGSKTLSDYSHFYEISDSSDLYAQIVAGGILINDGTTTLSQAESLAYVDSSGNLNGPVVGLTADTLLKLSDGTTGRYTKATGITVDASDNINVGAGSLTTTGALTASSLSVDAVSENTLNNGVQLSGVRHYANATTDPTSPTPADGDRYYNTALGMEMRYDGSRSKWLSIAEGQIAFGRKGTTGDGAYFRGIDGLSFKASEGRYAEYNGTVVSITYTRSNNAPVTFEVTADGTGFSELASTTTKGSDLTLNDDFSQNAVLGVRNKSGGNDTEDVHGFVRFRWRA